MTIVNYSDVTGQTLRGHADEKINLHDGMRLVERVGYARITSTLQSNIPIFLPSSAQTALELTTNPDKRLTLPVGAVVNHLSLRLPQLEADPVTPQYGNLQKGATLIGTTGEFVKVAANNTFNTTAPSIVCVANAYTPNSSAVVNRSIATPGDVAASSLIQVAAPIDMSLVVSNAGNTAAGVGIRTSIGDALAIVRVCWYEPHTAPTYEDLMQFIAKGRIAG